MKNTYLQVHITPFDNSSILKKKYLIIDNTNEKYLI
jgi:hypothetical protein